MTKHDYKDCNDCSSGTKITYAAAIPFSPHATTTADAAIVLTYATIEPITVSLFLNLW